MRLNNLYPGFIGLAFMGAVTSYAYDGRGSGHCDWLRDDVLDAQQELREVQERLMSARRHEERQRREAAMNDRLSSKPGVFSAVHEAMVDSGWRGTADVEEAVREAQYELEQARSEYDMNGCTSGGRTEYRHNYNH